MATGPKKLIQRFEPLLVKHGLFLSQAWHCQGDGEISYRVIKDKKVVDIVIDNPGKRNAINGRMMNNLADIVDTLTIGDKSLEDLTGLVLRGKTTCTTASFCAGMDFSLVNNGLVDSKETGELMRAFMTDCLNRLRNLDVISVCLLNGPALGGGAELATATDFRLFHENAHIRFVHATLGASPGWGGASRLYALVGRRHTLRLLASAAPIFAEEGIRIGLCDKVVTGPSSDDHMFEEACNFLSPYTGQRYPGSVKAIKRIAASMDNISGDMSDVQAAEAAALYDRWASVDNREAFVRQMTKSS